MIAAKVSPEVLPPAFFPVSLNLVGRRCVVIGAADDREAIEKVAALHEVGADVVWLQDYAQPARRGCSRRVFRHFHAPRGAARRAFTRTSGPSISSYCARSTNPSMDFVAMVAIVKSGRARISISTGGVAPRVGGALRAALQSALDDTFARFLECFANQRRRARAAYPKSVDRRSVMTKAADGFDVEIRLTYPQWFRDELRGLGPAVIDES